MRMIIAAAVLAAACGSSTQSSSTRPPRTATAAAGDDEMVCEMQTQSGTHIPHRVCRSPAEIEQDRRFTQQMLLDQTSRPFIGDENSGVDPRLRGQLQKGPR